MTKYSIGATSLTKYIRLYKEHKGIPTCVKAANNDEKSFSNSSSIPDIERYQAMSKEELIDELIRAKADELRAKTGYEVKGVGANKEFISLNNKNTKL